MSKVAIFSDLHIFAHLSKTQFEDIAINFLHTLLQECKKRDVKRVFFLGDWFHIKNKLYVPPFIKSIETLQYFVESNIELVFLIGNHDAPQQSSTDFSIMYAFKPYGKVIPLYEWEDVGDSRLHFLSYTEELPRFEYADDKQNVLFGHLDVQKFQMDSGFECNEGFNIKDFAKFDSVFTGHFHKHQIRDNIVYIGSPYQTRFSERHDDKGFIILDTDDLTWEYITNPNAPKFKEVDIDSYTEGDIKGNFLRIKTHKGNDKLDEIKNTLLSLGAESVDFIFENEDEEKELNMIEDLTMGDISELASQWWDNTKESETFGKVLTELIDNKKIVKSSFMQVFDELKEAHLSGWKPEE